MSGKKSSLITIIIFFGCSFIGSLLGAIITKNNDLTSIISYTLTLLVLFYYFKSEKMIFQNIILKIKALKLKKILEVLFYIVVYNISATFIHYLLSRYTNLKINTLSPYSSTYMGLIIFYISITIFPAIVEEIVFRGILLKNLTLKYNIKIAIVSTCLIFSFLHGISNGTEIFLSGNPFYLAYIYYKEKNILYPMIVHAGYNLMAALAPLDYIIYKKPNDIIFLYLLYAVSLPFILKQLYNIFILKENT